MQNKPSLRVYAIDADFSRICIKKCAEFEPAKANPLFTFHICFENEKSCNCVLCKSLLKVAQKFKGVVLNFSWPLYAFDSYEKAFKLVDIPKILLPTECICCYHSLSHTKEREIDSKVQKTRLQTFWWDDTFATFWWSIK